jgi:hypothetical protein
VTEGASVTVTGGRPSLRFNSVPSDCPGVGKSWAGELLLLWRSGRLGRVLLLPTLPTRRPSLTLAI